MFWQDMGDGSIYRAPTTGGTVELLTDLPDGSIGVLETGLVMYDGGRFSLTDFETNLVAPLLEDSDLSNPAFAVANVHAWSEAMFVSTFSAGLVRIQR